jgi:catechol 2,3-dioxygenase-like lactoylglutathione lyase family enzyme
MPETDAIELKAFVPARDFQKSLTFYTDLGFQSRSVGEGLAYLKVDNCSFLLQDFYDPGLANNLMLHLLVSDVLAWRERVVRSELPDRYDVKVEDVKTHPWGMTEFTLYDPSGVLWRIGQVTAANPIAV